MEKTEDIGYKTVVNLYAESWCDCLSRCAERWQECHFNKLTVPMLWYRVSRHHS